MANQNTRTIRVSETAWKYLNSHKNPGDTFADATDKIIDEHDKLKYETNNHRLTDAKPATAPADASRDQNDDPIIDDND